MKCVFACVNGSGWAVVSLCMRQCFFVNGGERAVTATSKPPILPVLKCSRQTQSGIFALNSTAMKLERFES